MARLRFQRHDILVPAPEGVPLGGPFGAFWMIPWANRLDGGRLGPHRLPVNRAQDGTAIHGLSRDRPWAVTGPGAIVQEVEAGPYRYTARIDHAASPAGFVIDLAVTNTGAAPMQFGAGWHPWFVRPGGTRLSFRASHRCTHDARCLPVSASARGGIDGG